MGYSQKRVAELLGHNRHGLLSSLECGQSLPQLRTALKLEIILRTPVAYLFPNLYDALKRSIRDMEDTWNSAAQQRTSNH